MYTLIVNPRAGNGRGGRFQSAFEDMLRYEGMEYTLHVTNGPGHATQLAQQAAQEGAKDFVFISGDGTFHEGLQGLRGYSGLNIAVLPGGNGNDFAKLIGMPLDARGCLDVLKGGKTRVLDLGSAGDRLFSNVLATGIDVDTLLALQKFTKCFQGMFSYLLSLLSAIFSFKHRRLRVRIDGSPWREEDILLIAVANGTTFGSGMKVAPHARADDGLLDVCFVTRIPKWRIPFLLPKFITGRHLTIRQCSYFKAKSVEIDSDEPILMQADGELDVHTPVCISIAEERFNFYVPV